MTYCGKCGENNPDDCKYCWKCGAILTTRPQSNSVRKEVVQENTCLENSDVNRESLGISGSPLGKDYSNNRQGTKVVVSTGSYTHIDVSAESRGNYRVAAWILILISYCIGAYLLFGFTIEYEGGLRGMECTLYDLTSGNYTFLKDLPGGLFIWIGILGFVLTFTAYGGMICALCCEVALMFSSKIQVNTDAIVTTISTTYDSMNIEMGMVLTAVYIVILLIAGYCMSRASMKYDEAHDIYTLGTITDFLRNSFH